MLKPFPIRFGGGVFDAPSHPSGVQVWFFRRGTAYFVGIFPSLEIAAINVNAEMLDMIKGLSPLKMDWPKNLENGKQLL